MTGPIGVRVRFLVTVLSAFYVCWIGWGPHLSSKFAAADLSLHSISGFDTLLAISAVVGWVMLAAFCWPHPPQRAVTILLGLSLVWWLFIATVFFVAGLVVAGGLAAIGSLGGVVAYWEARR